MKRTVLYIQYTNPANYPPLEHSGMILLKAGWDVRYFGIQSEGASSKLAFPAALADRVTLWNHPSSGWRQKLHYILFTLAALARAWWQRPAWVYCSDLMSCPAAWLILRLTRCKVLYHEHDSPAAEAAGKTTGPRTTRPQGEGLRTPAGSCDPGQNFSFQLSKFQRFLLSFRRAVGREADLVVLPNGQRLELFQKAIGREKPSLCVYNCPRLEEVREPKAGTLKAGTPKTEMQKGGAGVEDSRTLRLAFHGSINRDRLPLAILEAMSQFPGRVRLSVVGYETIGAKGYVEEFLTTARRLNLGAAVNFLGAMPRGPMLSEAAKCDVGLAFMPLTGGDVNMQHMTGASNKPFDYLACGLALLVSDLPDWNEMFVEPGYGLACDSNDLQSIAQALRWFVEHTQETRQMGERGRERILKQWNYEQQFAAVVDMLEK